MADDFIYLDRTGTIVPDTGAVQAQVEDEYRAALGADIVVTPNTPQGALIAAETAARSNTLRNIAAAANQINPNLAEGVFLDAIWSLTGGGRRDATRSYILGVELLGLPGTPIAQGALASLIDGTLFESVSAIILDAMGAGVVDFQALETGPTAANPGALNQVVTAVLGWDTVTNPTAAVLGRSDESDVSSRQRRKNTLSLQNVALPESAVSALYDTEGVRSLKYRENFTKADATIDGIFLLANSVWACVDGGTDDDIAQALLKNKSLGANWNGAVLVNKVEPSTGQTYPVKFDRPTLKPVQARVTVRNASSLTDVPTAVRQAIVDYANGLLEGEPGLTVGTSVSSFEFAGAVNREAPGIYVLNCEISLVSVVSWIVGEIPIALNELATILAGNIEVIEA